MIVLNKLVYSLVCLFFPFLLLINFLKTFWRTIVWFWHQMIFLVIISLIFIFFSGIFHGFLKNWIIHQLQKIFFEVIYCSCEFISIYCLKQAFWLSSIILCRFCNTNLFFIGCFKFRTCTTYFFLSLKLDTSFSIFFGNNGKSLWVSCNFLKQWTQTSRKDPVLLYSLWLFLILSLNLDVFLTHSKWSTNYFYPNIFIPKYDNYLFLYCSFLYLLLASAYQMNSMTYSGSDTFLPLTTYQYQLIVLILLLFLPC